MAVPWRPRYADDDNEADDNDDDDKFSDRLDCVPGFYLIHELKKCSWTVVCLCVMNGIHP